VLARFQVRAREVEMSARLVAALASRIDPAWIATSGGGGPVRPNPDAGTLRSGLSLVEGWRGTVCHRVELGDDRRLARVKVVDPSFLNWPALPVALADTIVPDFPLANKSFNQSYAGNDL
jgi:Ni,Fe-hydrogenase III large subunit